MHIWVTNEDVNWNIFKKALCIVLFFVWGAIDYGLSGAKKVIKSHKMVG